MDQNKDKHCATRFNLLQEKLALIGLICQIWKTIMVLILFQRKWYGILCQYSISLIKLTYADDKIGFNIKNYNFTQYTKEI